MNTALFCLIVLAFVGLSFANEDFNGTDHQLRGFNRKTTSLSVISSGSARQVFARGSDYKIYTSKLTGSTWSAWTLVGDSTTLLISAPSAVARQLGIIDVFAVDVNNQLRYASFDGTSWSVWTTTVKGYYLPSVTAVASSQGSVSAFVSDAGQLPYEISNSGGGWFWRSLNSDPTDSPAVPISRQTGIINVFTTVNRQPCHTGSTDNGNTFSPLIQIRTTTQKCVSTPAVSSWSANRLDVFILDKNAAVQHFAWENDWVGPEVLQGTYTSDISAVSWGLNRIDFFALNINGVISWTNWNGAFWSQPATVRDYQFVSAPTCTSGGSGNLAVFGIDLNGRVSYSTLVSGVWSTFSTIAGTQSFLA